jgi:hypothetical protein
MPTGEPTYTWDQSTTTITGGNTYPYSGTGVNPNPWIQQQYPQQQIPWPVPTPTHTCSEHNEHFYDDEAFMDHMRDSHPEAWTNLLLLERINELIELITEGKHDESGQSTGSA